MMDQNQAEAPPLLIPDAFIEAQRPQLHERWLAKIHAQRRVLQESPDTRHGIAPAVRWCNVQRLCCQTGPATDHLHCLGQAFPDDGRSQRIVPGHHFLHRLNETLPQLCRTERHNGAEHIGVAFLIQTMMEEDAMLQGSKRIDILDVLHAARYLRSNPVDIPLRQLHQGQHIRRDVRTAFRNRIGGNLAGIGHMATDLIRQG